jgi:uncharacterized protein (DUF1778 family)
MASRRSRTGDRTPSERRHVGLTVPRRVKEDLVAAAAVLDWSAGDWVLAAAAEHGPSLRDALGQIEVRKRPTVEDAAFTALYLTPDERDELDDQAIASGLNRSAFVTAVARLALGEPLAPVVEQLRDQATHGPGAAPVATAPADAEAASHEGEPPRPDPRQR